jgi:formate--tetrahydrofolate ligase
VLVASVKALKHHGGDIEGGLAEIEVGAANLARHIGIIKGFGLEAVVGVNRFPTDTEEELEAIRTLALEHGAYAAELNEAFQKGGDGATALAEAVVSAAEQPNAFEFAYPIDAPIEEKIRAIATKVYGAEASSSCRRRARRPPASRRRGSARFRSAWRRRTSRSRTTRSSGMRPRDSPCPSAIYAPTRGRAGSWRSAAT